MNIKKYIKYGLIGILAIFAMLVAFNEEARNSLSAIFNAGSRSIVKKMESQVDQGELALEYFDKEYRKAKQKLVSLRALKLDTKASLEQSRERVGDYARQGKEDLALKNREQVEFLQSRYNSYDKSITSRENRLRELETLRSRAREDVRLIREKISFLKAAKEALDDEGSQEMIEHAQSLINNLNSSCNKLRAEIEVINISDK